MKKIGKGRRGEVFVEEIDGKQIVIKKAKEENKRAAINKEIEILKKINNAKFNFCPQVLESGDGFFKYEFIEGERFDKYITKVDEDTRLDLIKQLIHKIYWLDKIGIVHGEMIRPFSNILVNKNNDISIIDFERGKFGDFSGKNLRSFAQWLLKIGYLDLNKVKKIGKINDLEQTKEFILTNIGTKNIRLKEVLLIIISILLLILADQITKYWIYDIGFLQNFYFFSKVFNYGVAFGMPVSSWIVYIASIAALLMFTYFYKVSYIRPLEYVLLLAGLFGNIIDRLWFGGVRDFIDLKIWPVFNVADFCLSLAVFLIVFRELIIEKYLITLKPNQQKQKTNT